MIRIGKPEIIIDKKKAVLEADVIIPEAAAVKYMNETGKIKNCLWRTYEDYPPKAWKRGGSRLKYEVDEKYADCLCTERSDGFVMAMLWYGIITGEDIAFERPMSQRLYLGITEKLMPELCGNSRRQIRLIGPVRSEKPACRGATGLGMSCGVDSLYSLRTHDATHLAFYEAGHIHHLRGLLDDHAPIEEYYAKAIIEADRQAADAAEIARQTGKEFVYVKSNLDENFYRGGIIYRSMHASLSCTLALQKLFSKYISSSSGHGGNLETGLLVPSQNYEELLCESCRTEALDYVSSDCIRRFEKIRKLADDSLARKYLNVCFNFAGHNCGRCFGCLKTMVVLDLLGTLDNFGEVFDLKAYYAERTERIRLMADGACRPELSSLKESWKDIVEYAKSQKGELSRMILDIDEEKKNL